MRKVANHLNFCCCRVKMGTDHFNIPPEMNREENRLKSFDKWTVSFIQKENLAQLGFFWVGVADIVKCFCCSIEIGLWNETDSVLGEHIRFSQYCDLICRRVTNNVPLCAKSLDLCLPPAPTPDECGSFRETVVEGNISEATLEQLDHEKVKIYLKKYGFKLVKDE